MHQRPFLPTNCSRGWHRRRSIRNPAPAGREASRAKRESPVRPRPLPCDVPTCRTISDPVRWRISHTHLAGKRPIPRQVEQYLAHLTGYGGDCRSVPAMTERVRGNGGERDKRVSRAFFCPRKLLSLSREPECLRRKFIPFAKAQMSERNFFWLDFVIFAGR